MTFFTRRPPSSSLRLPPPRSPRDAQPVRRARWHVLAVGALAIAGVIAGLGALGASMAACNASLDDSAFSPGQDGSIAPNDSGPPKDSSAGSDASLVDSSVVTPTSVIAVHASPDLWDFRLCFGYGLKSDGTDAQIARHEPTPNDVTKPIARTNFPGVPISGGAPIAVTAEMTSALYMTPYVLFGQHIAAVHAGSTCDDLVNCPGASCLAKGDYWPLNTLAPGAITPGWTNFLVVTGCPPLSGDPAASVAKCGPTYDAARGNLRAIVTGVNLSEEARPTTLRAAFANLNSIPSSVGPMNGSFGPLDPDAGGSQLVLGTLVSPGDPLTEQDLGFALDASLPDFAAYGITLRWTDLSDAGGDDGGDASPLRALTMGLDAIQGFSDPLSVPGDFYARGPFLFAVVGDPTVPGGAPAVDGSIGEAALRALHVVAIPAFPADTSGLDAGR